MRSQGQNKNKLFSKMCVVLCNWLQVSILVWGKSFPQITQINSEFDHKENKDRDLYKVQQLMLINDISVKAKTHHNSNESWLLCHQKAALERTAEMTANKQLAYMFCGYVRGNNSLYHQVAAVCIPH